MLTFLLCLALLIAAYFLYGKFLEKVAKINPKAKVPSEELFDGVDYVPLPRWKAFLIQLLNIAGIGPIFGAIMGACYGPVAFLWITFGGIFMGGMHDFFSGLLSMRLKGMSFPIVVGRYQGKVIQNLLTIIVIVLLVLVGVVFLNSPANILKEMIPTVDIWWWIAIIFLYYFVATVLPVDKLIAKIYPFLGAALIIMAVSLLGVLIFGNYSIPELSFTNYHAKNLPIIPTLFITIACGAISGFHATQSPLMARCINNEKEYKSVFYGSMISESIIALIWAAIAMAFFGGADGLNAAMSTPGHDAPWVVNTISSTTLGVFGGILVVLGVIAAPITSGDTAFRSARLLLADALHIQQDKTLLRFLIVIPLFAIAIALLFIDFDVIWRYFSWTNQALACIGLWTIYSYLIRQRSRYFIIALLPALFMTFICLSFVFISDQFVGLGAIPISYIASSVLTLLIFIAEVRYNGKIMTQNK